MAGKESLMAKGEWCAEHDEPRRSCDCNAKCGCGNIIPGLPEKQCIVQGVRVCQECADRFFEKEAALGVKPMAVMPDDLAKRRKTTRDFPREGELAQRIHALIDEYADDLSLVAVVGILHTCADDRIKLNREEGS